MLEFLTRFVDEGGLFTTYVDGLISVFYDNPLSIFISFFFLSFVVYMIRRFLFGG